MKSIRHYLFSHIVCGSFAILVAGGILFGVSMRHLDIQEFDTALEDKAQAIASLMERKNNIIEIELASEFWPEFQTGEDLEYYQFRLLDGTEIMRSESLQGRNLPFLPTTLAEPIIRDLRLPDGRRGRFIQLVLSPRVEKEVEESEWTDELDAKHFPFPDSLQPDSAIVVLGFARSRETLDTLLFRVYLTVVCTSLLLLVLIVFSVHKALRRGFRPLEVLNEQIREIRHDRLEQRIHLPEIPSEIASLPVTVNFLLDDLQDAFIRERRFVSDVAHELRTPVAEFRVACEVGAKWSDDPDLVQRRFSNLQKSAVSMERLLNGLLDLSRLDSGIVQTQTEIMPVAPLLDACWARVCREETGVDIRMDNRVAADLAIRTDPVKLEMIVLNLLTNAACYSAPGSLVICTGDVLSDGSCELSIRNPACDLEQADMPHILERFWRKDAARTGGRHAGLGLSIVKSLADVLDIQVTFELAADNTFSASLFFPPDTLN